MYATKNIIGRCVPSKIDYSTTGLSGSAAIYSSFVAINNSVTYFFTLFSEFYASRTEIAYCLLAALGATIVLVLLLRCIVGPIVFLVIFAALLACCSGTAMLWVLYKDEHDSINGKEDMESQFLQRKSTPGIFILQWQSWHRSLLECCCW